ncbi:MAG: tetratricopeptide repeat protein, partial [Bacteroidota bacterium]
TSQEATTWLLYGQVFDALHEASPQKENELLQEAVNGYIKTCSLAEPGTSPCSTAQRLQTGMCKRLTKQGNKMYTLGDFQRAIYWFEKAQLVNPVDTTALLYAGLAAQELGDYGQVAQHFSHLAEMGYPDKLIYETLIVYTKKYLQDNQQALMWTQKAQQLFPNDPLIQRQEISLLISLGQSEQAKNRLMTLVQEEPEDEVLQFNLGFTHEQLGDMQSAAQAYEKAVALSPEYFEPIYNLGALYFNHAAELFKTTKASNNNNYESKVAAKEEARKALQLALPYLEKAAILRPHDSVIWHSLSIIYSRLGMSEKAEAASLKLEELQGD